LLPCVRSAKLSQIPKDAIHPACTGGNGSVTILHERHCGGTRGRPARPGGGDG